VVAPRECETSGSRRRHGFGRQQSLDVAVLERDPRRGLIASGHDRSLGVGRHQLAEDVVKDIAVDDGCRTDLAGEGQRIKTDAEARDS
jgi:hypothetical protein